MEASTTSNGKTFKAYPKKSSFFHSVLVDLACHALVTHLCVNVAFDLFILTPPLWIFLRMFSLKTFHYMTTLLIHWTTPIVVGPPVSWCGMRCYIYPLPWFEKCKLDNVLALANHGSRVDWMMGMYMAFIGNNIRVGFVCEWLVKYLPLIGWYRCWVNEDIFVNRSFQQDKSSISNKISYFKSSETKLMLFLAPEGAIVDHDDLGAQYIKNCNEFCTSQGYPKFDYVLTPRYKGLTVLSEHVNNGGTIMSVCMAYVRDGVLCNEVLASKDRVVPDLYTAFAGIGGSPTNCYVYVKPLKPDIYPESDSRATNPEQIKKTMMDDYAWKDRMFENFHEKGEFLDTPKASHGALPVPHMKLNVMILLHNALVLAFFWAVGYLSQFLYVVLGIFVLVTISATTGKIMQGTTMEAVPFESGIKAIMMYLYKRKMEAKKKRGEATTNQTAY